MAGQNNHFLITILVGLAAVEDGSAELPSGLRASWAPRDRVRSAVRSREFANKAMLAWLVDALDAYMRALEQPPAIASDALRAGIAVANDQDKGLAGRVRSLASATGQENTAEAILVELAIMWRNRLVHHHARSKFPAVVISAARNHSEQYAEGYQGLRVDDLLQRAQRKPVAAPTMKEVTAIDRAMQSLVRNADEYLLRDLDLEWYLADVLRMYLTSTDDGDARSSVINRAAKVWGRSADRRKSKIIQIALNNGLAPYAEGAPNQLAYSAIDRLASFTPAAAASTLTSA